jgi:hypothetical protein
VAAGDEAALSVTMQTSTSENLARREGNGGDPADRAACGTARSADRKALIEHPDAVLVTYTLGQPSGHTSTHRWVVLAHRFDVDTVAYVLGRLSRT